MSNLEHDRPIVFLDLETTGVSPHTDRIVEISAIKLIPGEEEPEVKTRRINPGRPIPAAATAIHGIRDEDVAEQPGFHQVARSLAAFLDDADLAGFNILKFDLPMLGREFERAGVPFSTEGRRIVDVKILYNRLEPRTLTAAVRRFLDEEHTEAHGAESDAHATFRVLDAMLERHAELPRDVAGLERVINPSGSRFVDPEGKLRRLGGEVVLGFGKHGGTPLRVLAREQPDYLRWILDRDFSDTVKSKVKEAIEEYGADRDESF